MNYIKDNNMFTIVYINKETIELKQDYLLKNEYLIEKYYWCQIAF